MNICLELFNLGVDVLNFVVDLFSHLLVLRGDEASDCLDVALPLLEFERSKDVGGEHKRLKAWKAAKGLEEKSAFSIQFTLFGVFSHNLL